MVDGGIFPQRPHFVDDRKAVPARGANRRERIQHRRVRVEHVRREGLHKLVKPTRCSGHFAHITHAGYSVERRRADRRSVELPAVGLLDVRARLMARRRHLQRFPTERALLAQDCSRSKRVAAMQRQ